MSQLSEVDSQPLSDLVCNHLICRACGIVDKDWDRLRKGHLCKHCGRPSEAGSLVFPINIHVLVDLVQQTYHSVSPTSPLDAPQGPDVGTVLFYCTLRESLLNVFLVNNLRARRVEPAIINKLLEDNKLASQKFGGLFYSIVGVKWSDSVAAISSRTGRNFGEVSNLMREAAELRNEFLHEGRAWGINREFAEKCLNSIGNLVDLFVEMHNEYTQPTLENDA